MFGVKNFRGQDYNQIKKDCLKRGVLFDDIEFPATPKSCFYSKYDESIHWLRPKELCKIPKLLVEGVTCDDLNAGELDNNWFVTACASLIAEKKIWAKVFVDYKSQEWDIKNAYVGMFRFNFWRYGTWIEVVIDDRLPTRDGKLFFIHSKSRNEFWAPLLEKAYAKLFGDYESIQNGEALDALVDFTGGVGERIIFDRYDMEHAVTKKRMFEKLLDACDHDAHIVTRINCAKADKGYEGEKGLILGQGYILTAARLVDVKRSAQGTVGTTELYLVRLFNPWEAKEWHGAWSEGSPEWKILHISEWEKMGVKFQQEGEFWMCFEDYSRIFTHCDICHFVSTSVFSVKKKWCEAIVHGEWNTLGRNGGGEFVSNQQIFEHQEDKDKDTRLFHDWFIFKFLSNPQYRFDITVPLDRVLVSVEQRDVKGREALFDHMNNIGFHILKIEENRKYRVHIPGDRSFTSDYISMRSVFGTCKLSKGRYVLLPSTKEAGFTGQFMVRIYSGNNAKVAELTEEAPSRGCPCLLPYKCVTYIKVIKVENLEAPPSVKKGFMPFVTIRCEGEKVSSSPVEDTLSPVFNISAIFYRKKPDTERIYVDVFHYSSLMNEFVGQAICKEEGTEVGEDHEIGLFGKGKEFITHKPGKVFVFLRTSTDITLL